MVRRTDKAVFMNGAHVFPGGAVDDVDDSDLARAAVAWSGDPQEFSWRAAALRELFEEAGILVGTDIALDRDLEGSVLYRALVDAGARLDADPLEYIANWVTPLGPPRRFDARFFVTPASADAVTDDREVFDAVWVRPVDALAASDAGEWHLEVPTRTTLGGLSGHGDVRSLMAAAASTDVVRVAPRIGEADDGTPVILLPGDDGFDEAPS